MAPDTPGNGRTNPWLLRSDIDALERRVRTLEAGDLLLEVRLIKRDVHAIKERLDEQQQEARRRLDAQEESQRWLKRAFVGAILAMVSGIAVTAVTIVLTAGVG